MEDAEVSSSSSPARRMLASETCPISPDAKWYITDMVIEYTSENFNPTMINIDVVDSETVGPSDILVFKNFTPKKWTYDGTIALLEEITFIVRWGDTESFGFVHLLKSELESSPTNQIIRELINEVPGGPQMRLIFAVVIIPPDRSTEHLRVIDPRKDKLSGILSGSPELALDRVLQISDQTPQKPHMLIIIGNTFLAKYHNTRAIHDINNSVRAYELAVKLLPITDANIGTVFHRHGESVLERYSLTGNSADIEEAIFSLRKAIQLSSEGNKGLPASMNNLGISYQRRYIHTGALADISEAISFHQKSVHRTPDGHILLPAFLNNLGVSFQTRFERTGNLADLSEAISAKQKLVQFTPQYDAGLPVRLNDLGNWFQKRFKLTGNLADISEAIKYQQKSVQLAPQEHVNLPGLLTNLGVAFHTRFEQTGDLEDNSEAIASQKKSLQLLPEGHPNIPTGLNNLGISFQARFQRSGNIVDISEAISLQQKSLQLTPIGHPSLCTQLGNLAAFLGARFNRTGDSLDISEALTCQRRAIQLTSKGHADLPCRLSNLGVFLGLIQHSGDLTNISEAISCQQKAVQLTPEGHADLPGLLSNLAASFQIRLKDTGDPADSSEAISLQRRSVELTPEGHADRPKWMNNLSAVLGKHSELTGNLDDISEAISYHHKSLQLLPEGHATLPDLLSNFGSSYLRRFEHTKDPADVQSAMSYFRQAALSISGPPSARFVAARRWAYWSRKTDQSQLLDAYQIAINLSSQVAGLDQTIQNRYSSLITHVSELSSSAAAAAIEVGRHDLALEWLEQGRCLVWSQLNDLRTPIEDLRVHNATLADEIVRVSRALESAGSRAEPAAYGMNTSMTVKMSVQDEAHAHIKLAQEWDQLLIKVRAIPQFEDFLRPTSCSTLLKNLPESGPVVVINVHQDRSDALVLMSGADEPLHITLRDFSYKQANNLRRQLTNHLLDSGVRMRGSEQDDTRGIRYKTGGAVMRDTLGQLWTCVVKPILNGLAYSASPSNLARIWWCLTGPLAFLPIHAAGLYAAAKLTPGIYTTLSDFAISSYTPTVRSLVENIQNSREINQDNMGVLMISQPDTPGLSRIPGTTVEVEAIQRLLTEHSIQNLWLERRDATVDRIRENMDVLSCVHFACHASQDTVKPLESGFYLYDGRLKLSTIIKEQLRAVDLAFLSACQTSTGDEKLSEEAVHLAGGMLAAGYRGVVATMWSIKDDYGPRVAEEFYRNLTSQSANDANASKRLSSGAAHALHYATWQLRKTLDNSESSLLTWVPYVHFGL